MNIKTVNLGDEVIYLEDNIPDEEKGFAISNYEKNELNDTIVIRPISKEELEKDTESITKDVEEGNNE